MRLAACTALGWIALGGASAFVSAHAEFESTSVAASSTSQVILDVPHERAPNVYTTIVRIQIPGGWSAPSCGSPTGWTCSTTTGEVAFSKNEPRSSVDVSEVFRFALTAPATTGTTAFPVVQIYDTGENVLWSNSAQLQVVSGQTPTTAPQPSPISPDGQSTTTVRSESTNPASETEGSAPTVTASSPDGSNAVTLLTEQADHLGGAPSSTSDGAPILAIAVAVVVIVAGGGVAILMRRRGR